MIKKSYFNNTYNLSSEEQQQAQQLMIYIDYSKKVLLESKNFLDTIKVPFKNNQDMKSEEILNQRAYLRKFRDDALVKFNNFKISAYYVITLLSRFSSDPQVNSMTKALIESVSNIEDSLIKFQDMFNNIESNTFVKDMIDNCELLQSKMKDLDNILDERIKKYISTNVLGQSWVDQMKGTFNNLEERSKKPTLDLINRRRDVYKNR